MDQRSIIITKNNRITTIAINRPEAKNAVDRKTADELAKAFKDFEKDEDADVAVLCGLGGTFCAGADLKAIAEGKPNRTEPDGDGPMGPTRMRLSKPVIAAVSGYAVAGGMELALWCDMRVMEESAVMGVFCRRWGVPLIDGGTIRLSRLIGQSRAMDLILTGRPIYSKEALQIGLANRVVANRSAQAAAEKLALEIAKFPQICMRHDRLSSYEQWDLNYQEALLNEYHHGMKAIDANETLKGVSRFADGKGRGGDFEDI